MKQYLKSLFFICICLGTFYSGAALADANYPEDTGMQDRGTGSNNHSQETQSLTTEQTAQVASILSNYDASSLTAEDAKAINNAFRSAGIRRGPGQQEAIKAAGFIPKNISSLDPPPERNR